MRVLATVCCVLLAAILAIGQCGFPRDNYVPDSTTAISLAEAVLLPIFGEQHIERARPFSADLKDDVWQVYEEACKRDAKGDVTSCQNAGLEVQLSKVDGHIIWITRPLKESAARKFDVPNSTAAVKVAEAVLNPVYGQKHIESERPFTARLNGNVWTVYGTLNCSDGKDGNTGECLGGVAEVHISRSDAQILFMCHGK
jgi:hypothetical protein